MQKTETPFMNACQPNVLLFAFFACTQLHSPHLWWCNKPAANERLHPCNQMQFCEATMSTLAHFQCAICNKWKRGTITVLRFNIPFVLCIDVIWLEVHWLECNSRCNCSAVSLGGCMWFVFFSEHVYTACKCIVNVICSSGNWNRTS